jgi:hypothetical protein
MDCSAGRSSSGVEHFHGKEGVTGSNPVFGSRRIITEYLENMLEGGGLAAAATGVFGIALDIINQHTGYELIGGGVASFVLGAVIEAVRR